MSRSVLSQFFLSTASPRFASSTLSSRIDGSRFLRRYGASHRCRLPIPYGGVAGSRCHCSLSVSDPATAPAADSSSVNGQPNFGLGLGNRNIVAGPAAMVFPAAASSSVKKRIVSGVQPTGSIHLGNYLGAIRNWVLLQNAYETFFFIVDLHAITLPYDSQELARVTRETAALYIACGVDTSMACIFVQSHVRAHAELMWLLSSATPIGWLNRMIQFKEKSRKAGDENVGVALLTYPVLMAADILLYQSDFVPVGEDQKQHLELTRELAERVNYLYGGRKWKKLGGRGGSIFKVPEPLIPPAGARVMSLTDGLAKMSKSAPSDQSRINLLDPKDVIANKIKRCKTDSFSGIEFDNPDRPESNNLLSIYQLMTGKTKQEVVQECQDMNWGTFKNVLTDALIDHLHPIQVIMDYRESILYDLLWHGPQRFGNLCLATRGHPQWEWYLVYQVRYEEIMADTEYLDRVLAEGATKATDVADVTLNNVYQAMGFLRR